MVPETSLIRYVLVIVVLAGLAGCSAPAVKKPEPTPTNPEVAMKYALEGKRAYEQGRNMAAVEAWHQAFELNPEDAVTVNNLALLLKEEHRFEEAVRLLEAGLQYSPDVAQLHYNLAVIAELYLLDLEKALVHYEEYREISGAGDKTVAGWIADLQRRLD
ncbi:hypothetical protein KFJ24_05150 [Marinobacter sediminum]|nr:hypothetical protein [Marinobacter sediminum]